LFPRRVTSSEAAAEAERLASAGGSQAL